MTLQGPHQVAQKSTSITFPASAASFFTLSHSSSLAHCFGGIVAY
jgi:hypothetical protein